MRAVCVMFLTFTSLWLPPAALASGEAGLVKTLQGDVRIERGTAGFPAEVGSTLLPKDRIVVGATGRVGLSLKDETLLSLGPQSVMVIDEFAFNPVSREGRVDTSLVRGTLRYVSGLIGRLNPEAISVKTPTATVGIRGTDFIVEVPVE